MIARRDGLALTQGDRVVSMDSMDDAQRKVDWSKPIEAVHVDGRVVPAKYCGIKEGLGADYREIYPILEGGDFLFDHDGGHSYSDWTIRNVQTPEPEPAPAIDPALVERMVALVRLAASNEPGSRGPLRGEAQSILKALEPVDWDVEEAKRMYDAWLGNDESYTDGLAAAIRRGRQLEREKTA